MPDSEVRYFVDKLFSPRPTFPADMTDAERTVMAEHVAYWTELRDRGTAVAFGPVGDPAGVWGLAVIETGGYADAEQIRADDPVTRHALGRAESTRCPPPSSACTRQPHKPAPAAADQHEIAAASAGPRQTRRWR